MKNPGLHLGLIGLLITSIPLLHADTLQCDGVLGNSGEQGASLVRFGSPPASGLGVVCDSSGSLWDRAGTGVLNRYSRDGRLLASYVLPKDPPNRVSDVMTQVSQSLIFHLGKGLYLLPLDAAPGTAAKSMKIDATCLSLSSAAGWVAAAHDFDVFLVNADGEKKPVATLKIKPEGLEIGPDQVIYFYASGQFYRIDPKAPDSTAPLGGAPGERPQWIDHHWFAESWAGTIRRFDEARQPSPGVVLGGASGSFIGHLDQNSELINGRGLAQLSPDLFAVSGMWGILHLLAWREDQSGFEIVRRIGAIPSCTALALNHKGDVWYNSGNWQWDDGPATPQQHGVPPPEEIAGAAMLPNDTMVAYGSCWGRPSIYFGKLTDEVKINRLEASSPLPLHGMITSTLIIHQKHPALLILQDKGQALVAMLDDEGRYQNSALPVTLTVASPITTWTSLATDGPDKLLATADGNIIEFSRDGDNWKESRRWNSWGTSPDEKFGAQIYLGSDAGRLWVSDTSRHRVLCFDATTGKPVATFGTTDQAGDNLAALSSPQTLAARDQRAVVFDSGNQRLIKLELLK